MIQFILVEFLEILNKGGLKSYCDVLVMPHNLTSNNIISVDKWSGFTISVARNCLNIFKQSGLNLLLYTSKMFTEESSYSLSVFLRKSVKAKTQVKDYLRLPIQSDYLDELAIQRSKFLSYFQNNDIGLEKLYQYEQMKRQIFQTKSFYSFTHETDNAFKMLDVDVKLNDSDIVFLNTQQAHSCAPFSIDNDMQADFADNFPRYQNMLYQKPKSYSVYRNHGNYSTDYASTSEPKLNISCFVYTDLVQFDASFVKSQGTIDHLLHNDLSYLTPNEPIIRNIKPRKNTDLSKSIAEAFEKWNNEILVKSAAIDVASLKIRNIDHNTTIHTLLTPTVKEVENVVNIAKNYWIKLAFTQNQKSVWNRKQYMSGFHKWVSAKSRMFAGHSTPFEDLNNKGNYHAYRNLSIAGNIANEGTKFIFANLILYTNSYVFRVDHLLYFLLLGYTEDFYYYPLKYFKTNSFLLYDGQPIAIYLSKNNKIVELENNSGALIQNLDFWPGNLPQDIEPELLEEDEITDNTTADREIIDDDGTTIKTTQEETIQTETELNLPSAPVEFNDQNLSEDVPASSSYNTDETDLGVELIHRNNEINKRDFDTEVISPSHEPEDETEQQTNCLIPGLCAADFFDDGTKTKNDDGDPDYNDPCASE